METKLEKNNISFKPNKSSYLLLGSPILFFIVLTSISFILDYFLGIFLAVITIIIYFLYKIKYNKEEYTISNSKIIYSYGNLFSDNSVEVNLDKITQVSSILGFIQNKIFGTGNLLVNTAGSNSSKIFLRNINNTMDRFEEVQEKMKKNGFNLKKDKLVQEAKPHWLGIIGEVFKKFLINIFILFVVVVNGLSGIEESGIGTNGESDIFLGFIILIGIIILIVMVSSFIFSFLDLQRRKYDIYTDSIFYTEGFLTKVYSFLPMESVADTENTQSFWSKIFGLHDVIVSSEGANNKVIFKNMTQGEQMMKNIKYLKDNIIMSEKDIEVGEEKSANPLIGFKDKIEIPLDYDKNFKGVYKMSMLKSIILIIPTLIFPPAFIVLLIAQIIRVKFTNFIVESSTIEKKFEFLTNKHNSFSIEKITGITIKQSFLDKMIGTCSISFASIGSSSSITFANIKNVENLEKNLLAKIGIRKNEKVKNIPINFNFINFIKSLIGIFIYLGLFIFIPLIVILLFNTSAGLIFSSLLIIPIIILIITYIYSIIFYNKKRYKQRIHNNFIESISGILFITKKYVLLRHIKGIKSKKYPLTKAGSLYLNIAGEQIVESTNKQSISILSNSINISFVDNIFGIHNYIDTILNGTKIDNTIVKTSKQDLGNSIFITILLFGILLLFTGFVSISESILGPIIIAIIIMVIIISIVIWNIKVIYYNFEKDRILYHSGIIYKKNHTILYNKLNFIEKNQGFINKIFKNGVVKIYTLGGGSVEMKIKDIDNYKEIYDLLKK